MVRTGTVRVSSVAARSSATSERSARPKPSSSPLLLGKERGPRRRRHCLRRGCAVGWFFDKEGCEGHEGYLVAIVERSPPHDWMWRELGSGTADERAADELLA